MANKPASALVASFIVEMIEKVSSVLSVLTATTVPAAFSLKLIAAVDVNIGAFTSEIVTVIV